MRSWLWFATKIIGMIVLLSIAAVGAFAALMTLMVGGVN